MNDLFPFSLVFVKLQEMGSLQGFGSKGSRNNHKGNFKKKVRWDYVCYPREVVGTGGQGKKHTFQP